MFLRFDTSKAIQAAGVLMRKEPNKRMTRLRLLKLLVIADRRSLQEMGCPILGSKLVAMDNGPMHSDVYALIKGEHLDEPLWSSYFAQDGPRDIILIDEPEVGLLSKPEIQLLRSVSESYEHLDDFELSKMTLAFPEFVQLYKPGEATPIPLEAMIDGVGRTADKAEILQDLTDDAAFDRFFTRLGKDQAIAGN